MASALLASSGVMFDISNRGIVVFGLQIYWYGICIVCGMILAAFLSALLMKRRNMSPDLIYLLFLVCIPTAIVCARLFSCLTDPNLGIARFFDFQDGGLSVTGGVIGGVLAGLVVCLIKKIDFLRAADCVVPNILIAQALGRWGNFFNGEVYGGVVTDPALQWFPFAVPIAPNHYDWDVGGIGGFSASNATWHYAFFFYESLINLIGWAILFTLVWKTSKKPNGMFVCLYFVWYGIVRSIMEPLRDPQFILDAGGVPWSLVFSILMATLGTAAFLALLLLNYHKEGALIGSRSGDPCGITKYLTPYKDDTPYYSKINMLGANYLPKPEKEPKRPKEPRNDPPSDASAGDDPSADGEAGD